MYNVLFDGDIVETCETYRDARHYIKKEILDACREDALYGSYSKKQEQEYWEQYDIEEVDND